jgi:NCS1 family nucleobase:cation symporter-1
VIWPQQLYDMGAAFLAFNGTMYAPICGIVFADYFLLRRQRVCLRSIFDNAAEGAYHYWKGFNPLALGGIVLGQATYFFLYNPFTGATHALFVYLPASIGSFALPAIVYYAGMRMWGVRIESAASPDHGGRLHQPNI